MKSRVLLPALAALALVAAAGCGGGGGGTTPPAPTAEELTAEGWSFFQAAQYDSALARFTAATDLDAGFADAWNGIGWTRAFMADLGAAVAPFDTANESGFEGADAWAGLAAVQRELDPAAGLAACDSALARDPGFTFAHESSINAQDLHLIRGQAALFLHQLDTAQAEADILSPGNGLDETGPWEVGGVSYGSWFQALGKLFQDLEQEIGSGLP